MFEKIVSILQEYSSVDQSKIVPEAKLTTDLETFRRVKDIEGYLEKNATKR